MYEAVHTSATLLKDLKFNPETRSMDKIISIFVIFSSICYSINHTVSWTLIIELPLHEFRSYSIAVAWMVMWLLSYLIHAIIFFYPGIVHSLYYVCAILLIPLVLIMYYNEKIFENSISDQISQLQ